MKKETNKKQNHLPEVKKRSVNYVTYDLGTFGRLDYYEGTDSQFSEFSRNISIILTEKVSTKNLQNFAYELSKSISELRKKYLIKDKE